MSDIAQQGESASAIVILFLLKDLRSAGAWAAFHPSLQIVQDTRQVGTSAQSNENHLLKPLPPAEAQRWMPLLESVDLPLGHVLYESGAALAHVYFPTTAIVSLLYVMENGASAEIEVVGNEGIVGVSLLWAASPPRVEPSCKVPAAGSDSTRAS